MLGAPGTSGGAGQCGGGGGGFSLLVSLVFYTLLLKWPHVYTCTHKSSGLSFFASCNCLYVKYVAPYCMMYAARLQSPTLS